jgi:phage tail-like protein
MPRGIPKASDNDAFLAKNFFIEIGGISLGSFGEVSGLEKEVEVVEKKENGEDGRSLLVLVPAAGTQKATITLKRGSSADMSLWDWFELGAQGKVKEARKEGSVVLQDFENQEVARWNFVDAFISKISESGLKADGNEIAMEEVTIVATDIQRVK